MGYALDIILLCVFILAVIFGLRKGFVKSAARFLGMVISACLSGVLGGVVAAWVFNTLFRGAFLERVNESISGVSGAESVAGVFASLPDFIVRALEKAGVTAQNLTARLAASQGQAAEVIVDAVSPVLIGFIKVLAVVVLFMIFMLIVRVVANMLDTVFNLPILNSINGVLGGVFGLLNGLLLVWIVLAGIQVFTPMLSIEMQGYVTESVNGSLFAKSIISFNPLALMFQ